MIETGIIIVMGIYIAVREIGLKIARRQATREIDKLKRNLI